MSLKLYGTLGSPAVRSTLLTIRALGIKDLVKIEKVDLLNAEQLKPDFVKKNPLHTLPLLEDGNFLLWDSHAINAYLVTKYAKDDKLYPKDPQERALVDSINHFDTGYLFARAAAISRAVIFQLGSMENLNQMKDNVIEAIELLESILEDRSYVAGDQMTIADFSVVSTVSTIEVIAPLDKDKYPKVVAWLEKMKNLPYYDINRKGVEHWALAFNKMKSKM